MIETGGKDSSSSLKRRHYDAHRSELTYGGFLDSTGSECRHSDSTVVVTSSSKRKRESLKDGGEEEEEEGGRENMDDSLFKACGGRTAHKYVNDPLNDVPYSQSNEAAVMHTEELDMASL